jgi:4-amino-4-deoxy-L-arabinose transferase-like glycosyltransferase
MGGREALSVSAPSSTRPGLARSSARAPAGAGAGAASAGASLASAERVGARERIAALGRRRPELILLAALAAVLNMWALSRNGWANDYYSAAVRSMASNWHDFLYASMDRAGVMTVDKPPLALWVQALSVRAFGYHPLSVLVPQALMGVASVALVYDLVRRRFGRVGGFVAGLALALTPITVAVSRHNNPDALLVLCCVAALWFAVRALEDGSTRRLALAGVCVGLGFETKMGVALVVVPGIAAAWLWVAPAARGRLHAMAQLLAGGAAMIVVAGAWPALVELTPAADRPWVSGTSDNSVVSLIFGYNGLGRVEGQSGGPGGGAGTMFGGTPGPLRLLNSALGGQAGWLLGFALLSGVGILIASRLRRAEPRTGWLVAVGGAFVTTAVLFSFAGGIFHPYYVSLLAPFAAALTGAGAAQLIRGGHGARVVAPLAVIAGVAVELVVRSRYPGQLPWLAPVLIAAGVLAVLALLALPSPRVRAAAVGATVAVLLLAPAVWALDTLGYATSGTFPAGGPASVEAAGAGPFGGFGGRPPGARGAGGQALFGTGAGGAGAGEAPGGGAGAGEAPGGGAGGAPPAGPGAAGAEGGLGPPPPGGGPGAAPALRGGSGGGAAGAFGGGSPFGGAGSLTQALTYVKQHGGGTIAVSSQSSAASAIIASGAEVAGIGGFSGRESDVSAAWLAQEVRAGRIRWVLDGQGAGGFARGLPGEDRTGATTALAAVTSACTRVTLAAASSTRGTGSGEALYDCRGRAAELAGSAARESSS